jgi:hypothetical protein
MSCVIVGPDGLIAVKLSDWTSNLLTRDTKSMHYLWPIIDQNHLVKNAKPYLVLNMASFDYIVIHKLEQN